jgi:hypothetical protein
MMDDNQKKFIPPQASDAEFFSWHSWRGVGLTAHLAIKCLKVHASLFNDDLLKKPNFGQIHLTGQYL